VLLNFGRPGASSIITRDVNRLASKRLELAPAVTEVKANRILAVDYGRKRIGLALSDELGLTAQPLETVVRTNRRDNLRRLREICANNAVAQIVVGHPVHMSGEAGEMANEAALFAERLKKETGIAVELLDERLTSWEAAQIMAETRSPGIEGRSLDAIAAAVLLREYLERKHQACAKERD
jgi:putative holliday junction resolvase